MYLPLHIIENILSQLDYRDICKISCVSRHIHNYCEIRRLQIIQEKPKEYMELSVKLNNPRIFKDVLKSFENIQKRIECVIEGTIYCINYNNTELFFKFISNFPKIISHNIDDIISGIDRNTKIQKDILTKLNFFSKHYGKLFTQIHSTDKK